MKGLVDHIDHIIDTAIAEDVGCGDITTSVTIDDDFDARAVIFAKENMVVAGGPVAARVFEKVDRSCLCRILTKDGEEATPKTVIMEVEGRISSLLIAERTALNFLQRLSGIATNTRSFVRLAKGFKAKLIDTRKTTPGLRILEKYAVRTGGAANHRMGLFDGILIKDNHITAAGGIKNAVARAKKMAHHLLKIEVEVTSVKEAEEAIEAGADVIMFDNMDAGEITEAVRVVGSRAVTEISGGVTRKNIKELAATGADYISCGALIHSARFMDISMKIEPKSGEDMA